MLVLENLEVLGLIKALGWISVYNGRYNSIEDDYGTIWGRGLHQHLYVQVACTL